MAAIAVHGFSRPVEGTLMHSFFQRGLSSTQSRREIIADIFQRPLEAMDDDPVLHRRALLSMFDTPQPMRDLRVVMMSQMTAL